LDHVWCKTQLLSANRPPCKLETFLLAGRSDVTTTTIRTQQRFEVQPEGPKWGWGIFFVIVAVIFVVPIGVNSFLNQIATHDIAEMRREAQIKSAVKEMDAALEEAVKVYVTELVNNIPKDCLAVGGKLSEVQVTYLLFGRLESNPPGTFPPNCYPPPPPPPSKDDNWATFELPCKVTINKTLTVGRFEIRLSPWAFCLAAAGLYESAKDCYDGEPNIEKIKQCIIDRFRRSGRVQEIREKAEIHYL
jgi:hypothetical protein